MSLGRAVPWCSWDEWRQVGAWLTSLDGVEVQRGLDRVCAWRVRGRVPLGVDTTACLVETKLRCALATAGPRKLTHPVHLHPRTSAISRPLPGPHAGSSSLHSPRRW